MKEMKSEIEYKGQKYNVVFNLNVIEALQNKYGTFDKWVDLVQPKNKEQETDLKALKFAFREALNEGIDIDNEDNETDIKFLTEKQVGRIITEIGVSDASKKLQEVVIESTKNDEEKNV
jgi:hypothetical protein